MNKCISFPIKKTALLPGFFLAAFFQAFGQHRPDPLFNTAVPVDIALSISVQQLKKSNGDSTWVSDKLYYRNKAGLNDSLKIDLKSRGKFRLNNCYYPPLWIKIDKKVAKETEFEGNKKLKLVMPCDNQRRSSALILREYLCYKLYEAISPYTFRTRLVNIDLTERRGKKQKNATLKGILIEDLDKVAKRLDAEVEKKPILPWDLQDTTALRFYMFELLIANTDWSTSAQHNAKLIRQHSGSVIAIPYDFDMSGVVNAPYSFVSLAGDEVLPIDKVTERLYRGFCRSPEVTQFVRNELLANKEKLLSVPDLLKGELDDKEIRDIKRYLEDFFDILRTDFMFRIHVLEKCRSI